VRTKASFSWVLTLSGFALLTGTQPSFAIPSPELIVGSISSISQIVALLAAMVGGGAALAGARASTNAQSTRSARLAWRVVAVAALVLAGSVSANVYQYFAGKAALQDRLEATLTRPTPKLAGQTLDQSLKEASYQDQIASPRGISTADVERLLEAKQRGERNEVEFLDIRESAETEMGSLPGARAIRFPDLPKSDFNFAGKTAILLCHNGNRSYETCAALAAKGIDCRFMVGGLEKWLVEQRSLTGLKARTLADLRAVPPYRNQGILLDTPDVRRLLREEQAILVDVRYPGEFAASHLPGAINLPIRPTASDELKRKLLALPHRPIVAPCYDRRSCFFGEILGLELDRAGYDYRGRYTLPWELFDPLERRPYIQAWLAQAHQTLWRKMVQAVAHALGAIADHVGLICAILLLAMLSRLSVLPISLKAERDQIVARALADDVAALKRRFAADPPRLARAMRAFYRRHGLTPVRNLLGLLFLPLMAVSVAAVEMAGAADSGLLFGVLDPGERDPYLILPLVFAALICVYLDSAFVRTRMQRALAWGIGIPVFVATGALFAAPADLYLIASAALLLLQRAVVLGLGSRIASLWQALRSDRELIPLAHTAQLAGCGNKIRRLGEMRAGGLPVPSGVVLTARWLEKFAAAEPAARRPWLDRQWRGLGADRVAVRSSAVAEDGAAHSFAGVFDSVLDVDRVKLDAAICEVLASFSSERAKGYGVDGDTANILVQRMVDAEYAGVLFTRDPNSPSLGLVELVAGTADKLVSGSVAPAAFRFGRMSGNLVGTTAPPLDLGPLIALGRRAEKMFGGPQDVEWAYHAGQFYLVQSRDITRLATTGAADLEIEREWDRILRIAADAIPSEIVFSQNELSEVLPQPTPLAHALMESMWAPGGSVDLACRTLGIAYRVDEDAPAYSLTLFGRLYVDKRQELARAPIITPLAGRRLLKGAGRIERAFRNDFLPTFLDEIVTLEAVDFDRLATEDLLRSAKRIRENFVGRTHVEVSVVNIVANFFMQEAKKALLAGGLEPAHYLSHAHETAFNAALLAAKRAPSQDRRAVILRGIGHRAPQDYEFACPRYVEVPAQADVLCGLPIAAPGHADEVDAELERIFGCRAGVLKTIRAARDLQTLKEDAKHHSLREFAVLRRAILAIDRRFDLGGGVFELTLEEIDLLDAGSIAQTRNLVRARRERAAIFEATPLLPPSLTPCELEDAAAGISDATSRAADQRAGSRVSGTGIVTGRACVVFGAEGHPTSEIPDFRDGDIVVSRMVALDWIPYFQRAGGFVCEVGGWLSHTAIVARELDVALTVGAVGLRTIPHGACVRLHPDGTVELVEDVAAAA
jgi:rifampicin phosphotransferase